MGSQQQIETSVISSNEADVISENHSPKQNIITKDESKDDIEKEKKVSEKPLVKPKAKRTTVKKSDSKKKVVFSDSSEMDDVFKRINK